MHMKRIMEAMTYHKREKEIVDAMPFVFVNFDDLICDTFFDLQLREL